ncbi:MAG: substrate-binding domain-containing protein [Gammaproteobacteria bacterium]|nr:substrate-binding domain-containing protein [Gammaproteobacteria bacterium]
MLFAIFTGRKRLCGASLMLLSLLAAPARAEDDEDVISGAGAHFPWVIFDSVKDDLQKIVSKKIVLYGKNSMLGQGCNAAVKMAKQNTVQHETFGFVCCQIGDDEIKREGLTVYPLAQEPLAIILNKNNPVTNLTGEKVQKIFKGEIKNWKEVGGEDRPVVVITRLHCKDRVTDWKKILPNDKEFAQERVDVSSAPSKDVLNLIREVQTGKAFRAAAKQYELLPVHTVEQ